MMKRVLGIRSQELEVGVHYENEDLALMVLILIYDVITSFTQRTIQTVVNFIMQPYLSLYDIFNNHWSHLKAPW